MAKGFRTFETVAGQEAMLRRIVCEVRYGDGQLYLDHCGRLLRHLRRGGPEWVIAPEPSPASTTLHNLNTNTQLRFGHEAASLQLDLSSSDVVIGPEETVAFQAQLGSALCVVLDELEVAEFTRIGYREYYHFPFETKEASEEWLRGIGLVTVHPGLEEAFKATHDALGVAIVLQGETCRYRIGINGIERAAQVSVGDTTLTVKPSATPASQRKVLLNVLKQTRHRQIASTFATVVDVDAFLLDPAEPDVLAFVSEQARELLPRFKAALPQTNKKKR